MCSTFSMCVLCVEEEGPVGMWEGEGGGLRFPLSPFTLFLFIPQFFVLKAVENGQASFLEFETTGTTYEPKGDV